MTLTGNHAAIVILSSFGFGVADLMLPYPTMSEIGKAAAGQHYRATLFGKTTRRLVRALQSLPAW